MTRVTINSPIGAKLYKGMVDDACSGRGSPYISPTDLKSIYGKLKEDGFFIPDMEVFEISLEGMYIPRFDLSLLGLDDVYDWNNADDRFEASKCAEILIEKMIDESKTFLCIFWLDDL